MDGEANLPVRPSDPIRSTGPTSSSSSSACLPGSSPPGLLRHVQAAFKRHRPLGVMQSNDMRPRRTLAPSREASRNMGPTAVPAVDDKRSKDAVPFGKVHTVRESVMQTKNIGSVMKETQDDATITPPSFSGTITKSFNDSFNPFDERIHQPTSIIDYKEKDPMPLTHVEPQVDRLKKVQFSLGENVASREMEWNASNHLDASTVINQELKHQNLQNTDSGSHLRSDVGIPPLLAKRTAVVQDQLHHFRNFLSQPTTLSSVVGPYCATTTSVNSASAPMLSSTTYTACRNLEEESQLAVEAPGDANSNPESEAQKNKYRSFGNTSGIVGDQAPITAQASSSCMDGPTEDNKHDLSKVELVEVEKDSGFRHDVSSAEDKLIQAKGSASAVSNMQYGVPVSKDSSLDAKQESSQSGKREKAISGRGASVPRKRNYDPDLFFKVNGKLYQRLGKIGSGGSSEVHKVISSDCTIYALKKIKLKGRDYATAYGFCQEIEYLNKLKGKNNIIQLIDFEVTDKTLLHEVMSGSMNIKDGRVKDDGYIYMVLEYGEIDLAHMLSQKWKELDKSDQTIDENWLRFYWQQILQAVNTIHEERIVHSDLKPANFLLVKGSLKLIDFGIAKAIMSDTTNIQRDSQVGTLSYMSPEAFMCNENDANGNVIKCGRPSDIWSLGCILYQMVYGRTPFSEYKTFWSKFKVITDPNHEIAYEPVNNPWLLDLMQKCLAWDRNERWRIPQLLKHPFLVPPVPSQISPHLNHSYKLLQLIAGACTDDKDASALCSQLRQLLEDPIALLDSQSLTSRSQHCMLLSQMSKICFRLQEHLDISER
ncbi:serine/threonine-protein kinase MPS1 isoform X2 [Syzygium oleosum]|uniref:serine/threonine-protein kinase MPS1 isoform X2 n=1 Tax=Syzygium oleosum TaxID=219896 RepID=UPI0011D24969|nr:serine/threonine-protein kinase MPS1 isoform X2 [Syzygium oleosum]